MKSMYAILLVAVLALPFTQATYEKPNWAVNDYWHFTGDYRLDEEFDFGNLTGTGNVTFSIILETDQDGFDMWVNITDVTVKRVNGTSYACYEATARARIDGDFSLEGNFDLFNLSLDTIEGEFEMAVGGSLYFTTEDLAIVATENTVYLNITDLPAEILATLTLIGFNPNMQVDVSTSYAPPLDFMQFPFDEGDTWQASSFATVSGDLFSDWAYPSTQKVTFTFECTDRSDDMYIVQSDFNPLGDTSISGNMVNMFWDNEVGMISRLLDLGGTFDFTVDDYVYTGEANTRPTADFTYSPAEPKEGTPISFSGQGTDIDGTIVSWLWDFGNGDTSVTQSPTYTFGDAGTYTVTLTVFDNYGEAGEKAQVIVIKSSNSGGTPGFELAFAVVALALYLGRKRLGNFK
jgi:PKD repeat protein